MNHKKELLWSLLGTSDMACASLYEELQNRLTLFCPLGRCLKDEMTLKSRGPIPLTQ